MDEKKQFNVFEHGFKLACNN